MLHLRVPPAQLLQLQVVVGHLLRNVVLDLALSFMRFPGQAFLVPRRLLFVNQFSQLAYLLPFAHHFQDVGHNPFTLLVNLFPIRVKSLEAVDTLRELVDVARRHAAACSSERSEGKIGEIFLNCA
jgi:hypothetical protein